MTKGALIFAHNNRDVDYILLALISARLCKKNLSVPVSLVTDLASLEWAKTSGIFDLVLDTFDSIIEVEKPVTTNTRRLHDGMDDKSVSFTNTNRFSAWDLTPYQRTLLLDSDYLVLSKKLSEYWGVDQSVLIANSMLDVYDQKRMGYHDKYMSDTGPHLYWATTVIFTKNQESKLFFDTVNYVKQNYQYFADLFRFDARQFRNDIAFSVAKHILSGFEHSENIDLPPLLTVQDRDVLVDVDVNGRLKFLITPDMNSNYVLASLRDVDVHVMNKQSIVRNKDKLLALV